MNAPALLHEFRIAFPPDPPPKADEVGDLFVFTQEAFALFPLIAGVRWPDLQLPWAYAQDAEAFLLPHAFAYYLPAFLTPALTDPAFWKDSDWGIFTMWHMQPTVEGHKGRYERQRRLEIQAWDFFEIKFSGLNALQRETVARFLAWTVEMNNEDDGFPTIYETSRLEYWPLPGRQD